jgi:hypothetical protein
VFTVEMEDEETTITTIDESGRFGDVKILMDQESVGIITRGVALMTWTTVYI